MKDQFSHLNEEERKKLNKFPKFGCLFVIIGTVAFIIYAIVSLIEGTIWFANNGGVGWYALIGGIILFVILGLVFGDNNNPTPQ